MKIGGIPCRLVPPDPRQGRGSPQPEDGAFGFDELGVFGLNKRARLGEPEPRPAPAPRSIEVPARQDFAAETLPGPSRAGFSGAALTLKPPQDLQWPGANAPVFETAPHLSEPGPNLSAAAGERLTPIAADESAPVQAEEAQAPAPVRAGEADASHTLVVALDGDKVSIAVSAPPLDADGRALLRKLLRQLLAERRLSLADFQLNGAPLEADFLSMTGGSHGPRAR